MNRPALGLIVLRVDETVEDEFRRTIPPDAARLHVSRIRSGDDLTPGSIAAMADRLTEAAALLPPAAGFGVVGYACTSATAMLGAGFVHDRIRSGVPTAHVTDPLTATLTLLETLGKSRIGIVSPYVPEVARPLVAAFESHGITVVDTLSLNESDEARVVRIPHDRIADAARSLAARARFDALFLSCTNLRTLGLRDRLEAELGLPVLGSNHALAWHMGRLAGVPDA